MKTGRARNSRLALPDARGANAVPIGPDAAGGAPEWVELLPAGPRIQGRDGRAWINDLPSAVVALNRSERLPLPIDEEHATDLAAPRGEPAPAAGWIEELQERPDGSVWGRVEWTPPGGELVRNKRYRYLSPVFKFDPSTGRVLKLERAALTNDPNLRLTALNRQQEEDQMDRKKLCAALGLPDNATDDDVTAKLGSLSTAANRVGALEGELAIARNRADTPDPARFIPRADYDLALNRAAAAETTLKAQAAATLEASIEAEIAAAQQAGKIAPASAEHWRALCRKEGGLEQFKALVATLPVIADDTALNRRKVPGSDGVDAAALSLGSVFGNSADDLKKYGGN